MLVELREGAVGDRNKPITCKFLRDTIPDVNLPVKMGHGKGGGAYTRIPIAAPYTLVLRTIYSRNSIGKIKGSRYILDLKSKGISEQSHYLGSIETIGDFIEAVAHIVEIVEDKVGWKIEEFATRLPEFFYQAKAGDEVIKRVYV